MTNIRQIKNGTDNCYLVSEGREAILVDTTSAPGLAAVLDACSAYEMKMIVLTHPHFDHAENAYELSKTLGVPVVMSEADLPVFDDFNAQPLKPTGLVGRVVLWLSLKALRGTVVRRPEQLAFVSEGETLRDIGARLGIDINIDGRIIELPGHTLGSIGVIVGDDAVIVGDQMDNWITPAIGHLYYDKNLLAQSQEKLRGVCAGRMVYYGHGKPTKM
ncbi:Glyoxylase, beta-lactamase superfamily II [Ruminococcaceae bacterium YRB3002]|nr:Glyoxylase, beta-lactamase superfamily II [Ruminococcaceae bacterium YRB3002]